jgi:hypothetical protein
MMEDRKTATRILQELKSEPTCGANSEAQELERNLLKKFNPEFASGPVGPLDRLPRRMARCASRSARRELTDLPAATPSRSSI